MSRLIDLYRRTRFHIQGVTPHIQHNGRLANTRDPYAVQIALLTSKKDKTPEILAQIQDLEWEGSLYFDDTGHVAIPGEVIEGALWEAAKKRRLGPTIRQGVYCRGGWPLTFTGCEKTVEELRDDPNFRDCRVVKIPTTGNKVMRTRPVFRDWALEFELNYRPEMISAHNLYEVVRILGHDIGFSDDRRRHGGRFEILVPSEPPEEPKKASAKPKGKSRSKKLEDVEPVGENGNGEVTEQGSSEDVYVPYVSEYDPEPEGE